MAYHRKQEQPPNIVPTYFSPTILTRPKSSRIRLEDEYDVYVVKNLDPSTDLNMIRDELRGRRYQVRFVCNIRSSVTNLPIPVFFVYLDKNPKNKRILELQRLASQVIYVEPYRRTPTPPQCKRCQGLGHLYSTCTNTPRCCWCSGTHLTKDCSRRVPFATCTLCGNHHPATYKGCIEYKAYLEKHTDFEESEASPAFGNSEISKNVSDDITNDICSDVPNKASISSIPIESCTSDSTSSSNVAAEVVSNDDRKSDSTTTYSPISSPSPHSSTSDSCSSTTSVFRITKYLDDPKDIPDIFALTNEEVEENMKAAILALKEINFNNVEKASKDMEESLREHWLSMKEDLRCAILKADMDNDDYDFEKHIPKSIWQFE